MAAQRVLFTRRRFLASSVTLASTWQLQRAAYAMGVSQDPGVCGLIAEQEQGPFYIADETFRSDMAEGKQGVPLSLRIVLLDARECKPLPHAVVDVWHCDALGVYSGFSKQSRMGPGGPPPNGEPPPGPPPGFDPEHAGGQPGPGNAWQNRQLPLNHPSDKMTFLRGIQRTDSEGAVIFRTVFPGFYMGRTNHIHFKVRTGQAAQRSFHAGHTSHTGQIFFPESVALELMQHEPYSLHTIHRTSQAEDHVFNDQHGELAIARLQPLHAESFAQGMHAEMIAAVDPTASPAAAGGMGGPPRLPVGDLPR